MDNHALRNFKDFLLLYNKISEGCFLKCVNDISTRELTPAEEGCVDRCSNKQVEMNNRAMQVYVEIQPIMTQRRIDEMTSKQAAEASAVQTEVKEVTNATTIEQAQQPAVDSSPPVTAAT